VRRRKLTVDVESRKERREETELWQAFLIMRTWGAAVLRPYKEVRSGMDW
jgi:hypothetical protein